MESDEIGGRQELGQRDPLDPRRPRLEVRVVAAAAHAEGGAVARHPAPEPAAADDPEGLSLQHHPGEVRAVPAAAQDVGVGAGQPPGAGHEEQPRVLGGRREVAEHLALSLERQERNPTRDDRAFRPASQDQI